MEIAAILLAVLALFLRVGAVNIPPSELLATLRLPKEARAYDGAVVPLDFELADASVDAPGKGGWCGPGTAAVRVWASGGDALSEPRIFEGVCRELSSPVAWSYFRWASVESFAGDNWANFTEGVPHGDISPTSFPFQPSTNDYDVVCGSGSANASCSLWMFRGRYGSFIIKLVYLSTNGTGIGARAFASIVAQVDQKIRAVLD